ncbi:2-hydroxyhepta-2,4-diene-1,7-dioate isomerase [Cupriavidus basilensis OR16]|uniref:2-hydroxyhepta-2,4-diene-1,7-dioate isomerase n=1 Tax=Cupriavidus basilensis OR16 TaxID=1127483 RepID=H1S8P5_9BURK|nr:fumarylacetoacetate hydrolase family protein [Cupriavidus basilensis]EHP41087.1 2-hydroxyhepta-2,4-diene-1,7-dioate isomerase [Cupriavidus basilensis OR16]
MRFCRYNDNRLGLIDDEDVIDITPVLEMLPAHRWPFPPGDPLIAHLPHIREAALRVKDRSPRQPLAGVRLLSPVANPTKLVAAPVNYLSHLAEAQADPATFHAHQLKRIEEIGLFLKASSSLAGAGEGVALRDTERRNDHELELAVVIGKTADRVLPQRALEYVAGYALGLDMTERGPEERSMRKSIDTYSVLGPWLVTADEVGDPTQLELALRVNGELRQRANTRDLIVGIPQLIAWASAYYTLHPGDVIFTGTPDGVGPVSPGDVISASIEGVGAMQVSVRAA